MRRLARVIKNDSVHIMPNLEAVLTQLLSVTRCLVQSRIQEDCGTLFHISYFEPTDDHRGFSGVWTPEEQTIEKNVEPIFSFFCICISCCESNSTFITYLQHYTTITKFNCKITLIITYHIINNYYNITRTLIHQSPENQSLTTIGPFGLFNMKYPHLICLV